MHAAWCPEPRTVRITMTHHYDVTHPMCTLRGVSNLVPYVAVLLAPLPVHLSTSTLPSFAWLVYLLKRESPFTASCSTLPPRAST